MSDPLQPLAKHLGVSVESLGRLGVTREGNAWLYPERDADGIVVGTNRRYDDGTKRATKGSKRGLCYVLGDTYAIDAMAGVSADAPVLVVEGMTDAASGLDLGYDVVGRSTATPGRDELGWLMELLASRHVAIIAEHETSGVGLAGAAKVAEALAKRCASVKVVAPPEDVKDLRTWVVEHGCDAAELAAAIRGTDAWEHEPAEPDTPGTPPRLVRQPVTRCLADVMPERLIWLWPDRLPQGKLSIIAGNGGLGKSTVTMDIASRVTTGNGWPDRPGERFKPGGVVLLSAEDDAADTIRPRMDAAGTDVSRVTLLDAVTTRDPKTGASCESHFNLALDLAALEQAIIRTPDCKLVVIDPITAYMGKADDHRNAEVRGLLAPLARLAAEYGVAVLCVTHLNKGQGEAIHRIVGSIAFGAAARIALAVTKDPDDPSRRLMMNVKSNIAPEHAGLAFRVQPCIANPEAGVVVWDDAPVVLSADDAMNRVGDGDGGGRTALDEATDWLAGMLADGPRHAGEVKQQAKQDGIASRTLDRAKAKLGVIAGPDGFRGPWSWRLPEHDDKPQSAPTDPQCATPKGLAHCGEDGALWEPDTADTAAGG